MKKLGLLLALLMTLSAGMCLAHAEGDQEEIRYAAEGFRYALLEDGGAELVEYTGKEAKVVIPNELDGHPVTAVRWNPFRSVRSDLRTTYTVAVSQSHPYLATINGVLFGKTDKKLICCPPSLGLTAYEIPEGILSVGDWAFEDCTSLATVTIPDSVTSIGDDTFYNCTSLTTVTIPDSVTNIGDSVFYACDSLTTIMIPDSVTSIGDGAFGECDKLKDIAVSQENQYYTDVDGVLFSKSMDTLVCYPAGKTENSYVIPDSVISIGDGAFYKCYSLTTVTIPDSVTSIGELAFSWCDSLTTVTIPASVTSIGDDAFYGCTSLTTVTIPDSVTSIGDSAFSWCDSLIAVTIPDSVTSIGENAFSDCDSLTTITIPDSVTSIGEIAFSWCDSLTTVTIPDSVTSIGDMAFYGCDNLTASVLVGSYAETYCIENNIPYTIYNPDLEDAPTDWLTGD